MSDTAQNKDEVGMMSKYTLIIADYPKLPYTIKVMPNKVHSGFMGHWYRFWWKVLLGTEFAKKTKQESR